MVPTPEDIPLIIQLYSDLSLRAIAEKFDTTPTTISKILKKNKVIVKRKGMHKKIVAMLASSVKYTIDEVALELDCSPGYVKAVKKSIGLTREPAKKLDSTDFRPVRLIQSMIALGDHTIPEACAKVGITVNTYYYRKRIMGQKKAARFN